MNRNLNVSLEQARQLYKTANNDLKTILLNSFTKEELEQSVFDRVHDVESACREIGIDYNSFLSSVRRYLSADTIAYEYLKVITKALNEGWEANYSDRNQKKWFPYFDTRSSSGFAFYDTICRYSGPGAGDTSRLALKDEKTATYAGKTFLDLYKQFIL